MSDYSREVLQRNKRVLVQTLIFAVLLAAFVLAAWVLFHREPPATPDY